MWSPLLAKRCGGEIPTTLIAARKVMPGRDVSSHNKKEQYTDNHYRLPCSVHTLVYIAVNFNINITTSIFQPNIIHTRQQIFNVNILLLFSHIRRKYILTLAQDKYSTNTVNGISPSPSAVRWTINLTSCQLTVNPASCATSRLRMFQVHHFSACGTLELVQLLLIHSRQSSRRALTHMYRSPVVQGIAHIYSNKRACAQIGLNVTLRMHVLQSPRVTSECYFPPWFGLQYFSSWAVLRQGQGFSTFQRKHFSTTGLLNFESTRKKTAIRRTTERVFRNCIRYISQSHGKVCSTGLRA